MSIPVAFAPLCDDAVLLELNISFAALSADERCRLWELHSWEVDTQTFSQIMMTLARSPFLLRMNFLCSLHGSID